MKFQIFLKKVWKPEISELVWFSFRDIFAGKNTLSGLPINIKKNFHRCPLAVIHIGTGVKLPYRIMNEKFSHRLRQDLYRLRIYRQTEYAAPGFEMITYQQCFNRLLVIAEQHVNKISSKFCIKVGGFKFKGDLFLLCN